MPFHKSPTLMILFCKSDSIDLNIVVLDIVAPARPVYSVYHVYVSVYVLRLALIPQAKACT